MWKDIPKSRTLLYLMLLGVLPALLALFNFLPEKSRLEDLRLELQNMEQMALLREQRQGANIAVRNYFRDADHFYIDKHLETLSFLEPETESLQKLLNNKNLAGDEPIRKRVEFLTGTANSMTFSEGIVQSTLFFQETAETLVHPVEVNGNDIKNILARIEGIELTPYAPGPDRPQLLILDFKLDRKNISEKNEVFLLNLKLLKREFTR